MAAAEQVLGSADLLPLIARKARESNMVWMGRA
jgi:hypothetical protein